MIPRTARSLLAAVAVAVPVASQELSPDGADGHIEVVDRTSRTWHQAVQLARAAQRDSSTAPGFLVRAARANLAAGRPEVALSLLAADGSVRQLPNGTVLALLGRAEQARGNAKAAAQYFAIARHYVSDREWGPTAVREAVAWEAAEDFEAAARAYRAARGALPKIEAWLRVREARLVADTGRAMSLLQKLPAPLAGKELRARAAARLLAGDTLGASREAALAGDFFAAGRLALSADDSVLARAVWYGLLTNQDRLERAELREISQGTPPRSRADTMAIARSLVASGLGREALSYLRHIVERDSSWATLLVWGDALAAARDRRAAVEAFVVAEARGAGSRAGWRRARLLVGLRHPTAGHELMDLARRYPNGDEAPRAIFLAAEVARRAGAIDSTRARLEQVITGHPGSWWASRARLDLAEMATEGGDIRTALGWYARQVAAGGPREYRARFWLAASLADLGHLDEARGHWVGLAAADPVGYYGTRARARAGLAPLTPASRSAEPRGRFATEFLVRLDGLLEVDLTAEAEDLVNWILESPPVLAADILDAADGLNARGFVNEGMRLAWKAASELTVMHPRVIRAIWPWPRRDAFEASASEFGIDPLLLAALVRQESGFDTAATSRVGAQGLAQLMPTTAAAQARALRVDWRRDLVVLPDLNLRLGAAHLAGQLRSFDQRLVVSLAAYNAGGSRARRWLRFPEADDDDRWVERVPFAETRDYIRAVVRNYAVYRALYSRSSAALTGSP